VTALDTDAVLRETLSKLHPELSRYTYPLFATDRRDRPDLYASSVVLECDSTPILVTAAHAVFEITRQGSPVYVGGRHILPLPDDFVRSSEDGQDPLDIAAMLCPRSLLESGELEVLPYARMTHAGNFSNTPVRCIHGYPASKNRQAQRINVAGATFSRYAFMYAGTAAATVARYAASKKDPVTHTDLVYEKQGYGGMGGPPQQPPHPRGISGGGLWVIPVGANGMPLETAHLAGIAIEYHSHDSLVFATRVEHVMDFIRTRVLPQRLE
jgi:hypothetical protein